MKTILFTRAKVQHLRGAYQRALHAGHDQFEFEGQQVLTSYAKYLIEHLDSQFGTNDTVSHPLGNDL
jgi:hypothetical protein